MAGVDSGVSFDLQATTDSRRIKVAHWRICCIRLETKNFLRSEDIKSLAGVTKIIHWQGGIKILTIQDTFLILKQIEPAP
jgi:hypothetical protein